jgi:hypothetical protein
MFDLNFILLNAGILFISNLVIYSYNRYNNNIKNNLINKMNSITRTHMHMIKYLQNKLIQSLNKKTNIIKKYNKLSFDFSEREELIEYVRRKQHDDFIEIKVLEYKLNSYKEENMLLEETLYLEQNRYLRNKKLINSQAIIINILNQKIKQGKTLSLGNVAVQNLVDTMSMGWIASRDIELKSSIKKDESQENDYQKNDNQKNDNQKNDNQKNIFSNKMLNKDETDNYCIITDKDIL